MDEMKRNEPLSVGGWIGTLILLAIPIVSIIMVFVWAFGRGNISRKNFAIALLILTLIGIIVGIVLSLVFGFSLAGLQRFQNMYPM